MEWMKKSRIWWCYWLRQFFKLNDAFIVGDQILRIFGDHQITANPFRIVICCPFDQIFMAIVSFAHCFNSINLTLSSRTRRGFVCDNLLLLLLRLLSQCCIMFTLSIFLQLWAATFVCRLRLLINFLWHIFMPFSTLLLRCRLIDMFIWGGRFMFALHWFSGHLSIWFHFHHSVRSTCYRLIRSRWFNILFIVWVDSIVSVLFVPCHMEIKDQKQM